MGVKKCFEHIPHFAYPGGPDPITMAASPPSSRGRSPYSAPTPFLMLVLERNSCSHPPSRAPSPHQSCQQSESSNSSHRTPSPDVRTGHRAPPRGHSHSARTRTPSLIPASEHGLYLYPPSRAPSPHQSCQQSESSNSSHRTPSPDVRTGHRAPPRGHSHSARTRTPSLIPVPEHDSYSPPPHRESVSDSSPHPFVRPIDTTQSYDPFDEIRIQGMDEFFNQIPSMPSVLDTHDVHHRDWNIFMNDISLAWMEKLPLPQFAIGRPRSSIVEDLINKWNKSFFSSRQVAVVLYKGREIRSGLRAGIVDDYLSLPDSESDDEGECRKYWLCLTCVTRGRLADAYTKHEPRSPRTYYQ
ncbi:hypothetical protein BDR06DRAFT_57316 [Suillus hirtellus]|nr:hypothetical protein BDR06DRAFT_57316 [Suillus hirtellus]